MGSTLADFLRQIPPVILVPFCASALLLVIVLVLIARARLSRNPNAVSVDDGSQFKLKRKRGQIAKTELDLPDLDMLVDTTTLINPPTPEPALATAAGAPARPAQTGVQPLTLTDGATVQAVEVLRVLRDITGGGLVVQMGDRAYRTLAQDETFRADFLKIMRELSPLVRNTPSASVSTPAAPTTTTAPKAIQPPVETAEQADETAPPSLGDLLAVRPTKPTFTPPPPPGGELPGDLPRFRLSDAAPPPKSGLFRRRKGETPPPVPELNIADAIEAYVQHRLQLTPELANRKVHIHPSSDGGVVIEADGVFYDTVDEVQDETVRQFLRLAIAEWQNRLK